MGDKELRGRPTSSPIRDNLVELLFHIKQGYGYDLYKKYVDYMFPGHLEAAMVMKEFDTVYGELGYSRLTHKEWTR